MQLSIFVNTCWRAYQFLNPELKHHGDVAAFYHTPICIFYNHIKTDKFITFFHLSLISKSKISYLALAWLVTLMNEWGVVTNATNFQEDMQN
jgi:hypothetical protein